MINANQSERGSEMAKQKGTKANYINYGGRPVTAIVEGKVTGLCLDKHTKTYYYMYADEKGKRKKKYVTRDLTIAYNRFMEFAESKREEEFLEVEKTQQDKKLKKTLQKNTIKIDTSHLKLPDNYAELLPSLPDEFYDKTTKVSEQEFFAWLDSYRGKEEELKRKSGIAIRFIGKTDRITHIKLLTILDFFNENIKFKTQKTKDDYSKWIEHFFDFTEVSYIDDITEDIVRRYESKYLDPTRKKGNPKKPKEGSFAYKWKNDRAGAIKRVLSFYSEKHPSTSAKVKEIREYLMIWDRTKDRKPLNPECISKEDFKKLYNSANVQWKAILLMSLNTMSYGKDLHDMEVAHIDKKRKTLTMIREKEESLKVGFLWDETITALEAYEEVKKGDSDFLFTSRDGGEYKVQSMMNYIREFSRRINKNEDKEERLSLPNVTFEMFRNGASTAADDGKIEYHYIEYGLGHQMSGAFTNYVKRKPERMKPIADNIYKEYEIDKLSE